MECDDGALGGVAEHVRQGGYHDVSLGQSVRTNDFNVQTSIGKEKLQILVVSFEVYHLHGYPNSLPVYGH